MAFYCATDALALSTYRPLSPAAPLRPQTGINERGDIVGYYYDLNGSAQGFLLSKGQFNLNPAVEVVVGVRFSVH
jgi:hypothetical protein